MENKKSGIMHYAWLVLLATIIFNFFYAMTYSTISLYMVPWLEAFPQYTRTAFSWVSSLHSVTSTVLLLFFGKLTKKFDMRILCSIGALGAAIGLFIYSIATNIWIFYLGALFVGFSCAFCATTTTSILVNRWFGKLQNTLLAVSMTIGGFGGTVGSIWVGKNISALGYAPTLKKASLIMLVVAVVIFVLIRNYPKDRKTSMLWQEEQDTEANTQKKDASGVPFKAALKTPNFWFIIIFWVLFAMFFYGTYVNLANVMYDFGLEASVVGVIFSFVATAMTIAMIPGGAILDFLGARRLMVILTLIFAVILAVLGFTTPDAGMMRIICIFFGIVYLIPKICVPAVIKTCFGNKDLPTILGIATGCITFGAIFASPMLNRVYDITGSYSGAFKVCAFGAVACAIICLVFIRKCKKDWVEE